MLRIQQLKVPLAHDHNEIEKRILKQLHIEKKQLIRYEIRKQSIDARKKKDIFYSYTVDVEVKNEKEILKKVRHNVTKAPEITYQFQITGEKALQKPPIIIGAGPAGLFCAYMLALHGYQPIVIERGCEVEQRTKDVEAFWETGVLNPSSNVQFGEGGAGTFSDGKLNTLVKDHMGRNKKVLDLFIDCGAPKEIAYVNKPHIGTDILVNVVKNLRNEIIRLGGIFYFQTCLTDVRMEQNKIKSIEVTHDGVKETIETDILVLALGHSARDTFEMLYARELPMEAKSFAVGMRVEHPQDMIDKNQYGDADMEYLPTAAYKLTAQTTEGRGVYSFCMCPGGFVVNASSEPGRLAVNGMSYFKRDSKNANSAIIVSVTPEDYKGDGPLSGIQFQRELEEKAYELGKGAIPQQLYGDFKKNQASTAYGAYNSCIKGASCFANLRELFTESISNAFMEAMETFPKYIHEFNREDAILSGVESRTSSPVRLPRNEAFESEIQGIFPCGEGAGYAGGIMSAAMDGLKIAEAIATQYTPEK